MCSSFSRENGHPKCTWMLITIRISPDMVDMWIKERWLRRLAKELVPLLGWPRLRSLKFTQKDDGGDWQRIWKKQQCCWSWGTSRKQYYFRVGCSLFIRPSPLREKKQLQDTHGKWGETKYEWFELSFTNLDFHEMMGMPLLNFKITLPETRPSQKAKSIPTFHLQG